MNTDYVPERERQRLERILLDNMRKREAELREVLKAVNSEWCYEDRMYRFYYQSFEVFDVQNATRNIADILAAIAPEGRPFCFFFAEILKRGTDREFSPEDNEHWLERVGPVVHAFLHSRFFLEMAVKYAPLAGPPQPMPSGWAALLCLYGLR
jgi:hypothetical protein